MKKILIVLCVTAFMACMTGCGCGTMEDSGGTSVESTSTTETTEERTTEERTTEERTTEERTTEERTTEEYESATKQSDGILEDIEDNMQEGIDDIVGTTEETTEGTTAR